MLAWGPRAQRAPRITDRRLSFEGRFGLCIFGRRIDAKPGRFASAIKPCDPWAHRPLQPIARGVYSPADREPFLQRLQVLVGKEFNAWDGVRCGAVLLQEGRVAFRYHLPSTLLSGVPGSIADDYRAAAFYASQRLAQARFVIFGIMERSVEDDGIELLAPKRQVGNLRLESRQRLGQVASIMLRRSKAILPIGEQIHCNRVIAGEGEAKAHPAVAGADIQDGCAGRWRFQYVLGQTVVAARPDVPLPTVPPGAVFVRKPQIILFALATSAFLSPYALVIFHEASKICGSLRRKCMHNSSADPQSKSAVNAAQRADGGAAARTLDSNAKETGVFAESVTAAQKRFRHLCLLERGQLLERHERG